MQGQSQGPHPTSAEIGGRRLALVTAGEQGRLLALGHENLGGTLPGRQPVPVHPGSPCEHPTYPLVHTRVSERATRTFT